VTEQYTVNLPLTVTFYGRHLKQMLFTLHRVLSKLVSIPSSLLLVTDKATCVRYEILHSMLIQIQTRFVLTARFMILLNIFEQNLSKYSKSFDLVTELLQILKVTY
jgi:hypothetical protein